MAEGREAVDLHQSNCKKPRVWPLNPSHYGQIALWPKSKGHRNLEWLLFEDGDGLSKEVWVRREWKSKPWSRGCLFFHSNNQLLTRSWPLDWRSYFEQGIKWDAPLSLDFRLGLWRLHTIPNPSCTYYILLNIFNPFLWTQQSLAIQPHGLSTWTAIVNAKFYNEF
jgi:hypothetical protein